MCCHSLFTDVRGLDGEQISQSNYSNWITWYYDLTSIHYNISGAKSAM